MSVLDTPCPDYDEGMGWGNETLLHVRNAAIIEKVAFCDL